MKLTQSSLLAALASLAAVADAHMAMIEPAPFRSKNNPNVPPEKVNAETMTSPIGKDTFPCRGYQVDMNDPNGLGKSVATYAPGSAASVTIGTGAAHGGGSCQISLS